MIILSNLNKTQYKSITGAYIVGVTDVIQMFYRPHQSVEEGLTLF